MPRSWASRSIVPLRRDSFVVGTATCVAAFVPASKIALVVCAVFGWAYRTPPGRESRRRDPNDQRARVLVVEPVDGVFPVGNGRACQDLALARDDARPVRRFPDVEPYDGSLPGGWCHGGILQSSGRSEGLPLGARITWPFPPGPGSFLSVARSGERLRWQHPPALERQGQRAIRRRPIGGPSGLGQTVGHVPNDRHRSSSMAYLRL